MPATKVFLLSVLFAITSSVVARRRNGASLSIVGGEEINPGEYPYFVEMGTCGGTLIAPDIVLFAAHCKDFTDKQINIGAYRRSFLEGGSQERFCDVWVPDPNFNSSSYLDSDFALCKLNEPVLVDDSKIRFELNEDNSIPGNGDDLIVMGLGRRNADKSGPEYVHDVTVPYVSNAECESVWGSYFNNEKMMCAGYETGGKDSCIGDSGGPLVRRTVGNDGLIVDTHVGIVSFGIPCAKSGIPTIYARTSSRVDWIKNTMCNVLQSVASVCNNPDPPPPSNCDGHELNVEVATNYYAFGTSWELIDSKGNIVMARTYRIRYHVNEHKLCLKSGKRYKWVLRDRFEDTTCGDSCGYHSLKLDGEEILIKNRSNYGEETSIIFSTPDLPTTAVPDLCKDEDGFLYKSKPKKDCKWAGKSPQKRCKRRSIKDGCPSVCNLRCSCDDSQKSFLIKGTEEEFTTCEAVTIGDCNRKTGARKMIVADFCPKTCMNCYE